MKYRVLYNEYWRTYRIEYRSSLWFLPIWMEIKDGLGVNKEFHTKQETDDEIQNHRNYWERCKWEVIK